MAFGFVKVAAAVPRVRVADTEYNCSEMIEMVKRADREGIQVIVFPELSVTGYTCGDLFSMETLLSAAECGLDRMVRETAFTQMIVVVGMPVRWNSKLFNCAVVFSGGEIYGAVPKSYLPNGNEFYETRWFSPGGKVLEEKLTLCGKQIPFEAGLLFDSGALCMGVEVCEDLWAPIPPSSIQAKSGANLIVNLSASDELVGKHAYLRSLVTQQSARLRAAYVYASAGFGESSTDLVFAGNALIAETGTLLAESERFTMDSQLTVCEIDLEKIAYMRRTDKACFGEGCYEYIRRVRIALPSVDRTEGVRFMRNFDPYPFVPSSSEELERNCREAFAIQSLGLCRRLQHTGIHSVVIGISGGLDSTLALMVCVDAFDRLGFDRKGILAVTMPGFGTTDRTYANALALMGSLGVSLREIPIREACEQHFRDIGLDPGDHGAAYENAQARERTQILMDLANMSGGLVIGTGDLSELALGWATYNGDHMSMYGVNGGVPKTFVRALVLYLAAQPEYAAVRDLLLDVAETPVSPELLPAGEGGETSQKTEDLVGPYELHDFFLYNMLHFGFGPAKMLFVACRAFEGKYDSETVRKWLVVFVKRFFSQQFKRSALPDGPKVGSVSLSPRGDWRMPSDACAAEWLREIGEPGN